MRALLLAGGYGTRLKPLTNKLPKCMVPINGRPLLDIWLEFLVSNGIKDILVNTHYKSNFVENYIKKSTWKDSVTITFEKNLLGTAGTILANKDFFNNESFFVAHADNLTDFNLTDFIKKHNQKINKCPMTMMLFETDNPSSCGVVKTKDDIVIEFYEKKKEFNGKIANGAIFIFEPSIFQIIKKIKRTEIDISKDLIPILIGKINSYFNETFFMDIGNIVSYNKANEVFKPNPMNRHNNKIFEKMLEDISL